MTDAAGYAFHSMPCQVLNHRWPVPSSQWLIVMCGTLSLLFRRRNIMADATGYAFHSGTPVYTYIHVALPMS